MSNFADWYRHLRQETEDVAYLRDLEEVIDGFVGMRLGLYAVLHFAMKPGRTVCFDEPDNFVSLREILPWLTRTLEQTEHETESAQVLIASHHPELLNRMAIKEGLLFDRSVDGQSRAQAFGPSKMSGLSVSELVARGWDRG